MILFAYLLTNLAFKRLVPKTISMVNNIDIQYKNRVNYETTASNVAPKFSKV